jgi:hypothetical protein
MKDIIQLIEIVLEIVFILMKINYIAKLNWNGVILGWSTFKENMSDSPILQGDCHY